FFGVFGVFGGYLDLMIADPTVGCDDSRVENHLAWVSSVSSVSPSRKIASHVETVFKPPIAAASFAFLRAATRLGVAIAATSAKIAITIMSSTSVNPLVFMGR